MNDQIAIQYALFRGMRSCGLFNSLNVVLGRDYLASKVQQDAVWQIKSPAGTVGIGGIIQIPTLRFPKPNSLQREREYRIGIYEEPDSNWTPGVGSLRGADDWGDQVIDFLWNWRLWRASGLVLQDNVLVPDTRWADQGIVGVQAVCTLRQERRQPARCDKPAIVADPGRVVTMSVTDGSKIYYTTDGFSMPAPDNDGSLAGEQAATLYAGPFQVAAGTVIMAAAWPADPAAGLLPSQTNDLTVI